MGIDLKMKSVKTISIKCVVRGNERELLTVENHTSNTFQH